MSNEHVLEILKSAILIEKKGHAFYDQIAKTTTHTAVRQFFGEMAEEEKHHIRFLEEQYRFFCKEKSFNVPEDSMPEKHEADTNVITAKIKAEIGAASYEAAAISAAINMEQNARKLYEKRAGESSDADEVRLYQWLANWEAGHLNLLIELDKQLQEKVWYDNQFWPM